MCYYECAELILGHALDTKKLLLPEGVTADFYLLLLCDPPLIFCIAEELR